MASDAFITELDSAAVEKKIRTRLHNTDQHAPVGAILANDVLVSTAAPLPVTSVGGATQATLATIDTDTGNIATAAATIAGAVSGTEMQVDIVSGAVTLSGSVSMGVPTGNTKKQIQKNYTTAQVGTDLWDPAASKRIAVKSLFVSWSGANACRISIWEGANADTTFTEGTDPWLFDITLLADAAGGAILTFPDGYPWETVTADNELHITISANKVVSVSIIGDERT